MWSPAGALSVSKQERALLEEFLRAGNTPQKVAFRVRVILGAANGLSNNALAAELQTTRSTVLKWRARFGQTGIEGILTDAPGRGRKKRVDEAREAAIVEATLQTKPAESTHWSTRTMAASQGVSDSTVFRIWRKHRLQPHRVETFKASKDPNFVEKVRDIAGAPDARLQAVRNDDAVRRRPRHH